MARVIASIAAAWIALASSPGWSKDACPAREPGTYPWAKGGVVNGDLYAWVYLKIRKDGRPDCFMGQNNIHDSDQRFFLCNRLAEGWKPARPEDAVPGAVVKRLALIAGPDHDKINKQARKQFFAQHPDENPDCYPE